MVGMPWFTVLGISSFDEDVDHMAHSPWCQEMNGVTVIVHVTLAILLYVK
jgi:hypothetical protein